MKFTQLAISAIACALTVGPGSAVAQYGSAVQQRYSNRQQPQYQSGYGDGDADDAGGSDGYARQYQRFQDRGYHDGYQGAFKDFQNHRSPTPMNRDEYRHPDDVPRQAMRVYRIAFRQGYLQGEVCRIHFRVLSSCGSRPYSKMKIGEDIHCSQN